VSESALIERIARTSARRPGTLIGIGDDAAVIETGGPVVVSHDMLVEDVHFRRATTGPRDLGAKALAVNLSDLAAMGAVPVAAVVGLGLPPGYAAGGDADALQEGIEETAAAHGLTVAGGDVSAAPVLVVGVTVIGRPVAGVAPVTRAGGRAGDLLVVTGALGASAAGLELLERPDLLPGLPARDALVAAHRRPEPRLAAGRALAAGGARAMMDVSDGLVIDAGRLAVASGLRATLSLDAVPVADGVAAVAAPRGVDAAALAATGGEDFELLAALPPGRLAEVRRRCDLPLTVVGELSEGEPGAELRDGAGARVDLERTGWEHRV
jgi:thiamine-monophosphate kinase